MAGSAPLALFLALSVGAEPLTARFTAPEGDRYQVTLTQDGATRRCEATPCDLPVKPGPATIAVEGTNSFELEHTYDRSVKHTLAWRATWPRWLSAILFGVSLAGFALGGLSLGRCGGTRASDQATCRSASVGFVLGGAVFAVAVPLFIWGLFTGNRTTTEDL